VVDQEVRE
jgi:hypothetical protein